MAYLLQQSASFAGRFCRPVRRTAFRSHSSRVRRASFAVRSEKRDVVHDSTTERATTAAVPATGSVTKVNADELEAAIQNRDRAMVVDFYADWCGPCVLMANELVKVAQELGDSVQILKVDAEANRELSSQLNIKALPTIMMISKDAGKPVLRREGFVPAKTVLDIITSEL